MARIRGRGAEDPPAPPADTAAAPSAAEQPTLVVPAQPEAPAAGDGVREGEGALTLVEDPAVAALPAGADLVSTPSPERPGFRERGRLRRRLRHLRRLRELGFRDLGGLVHDLDRFGRDRPDLVRAKLEALATVDAEVRRLEEALDDVRPVHELHEPGVAACARCGALHGSDARFCPNCGLSVHAGDAAAAATAGALFAAGASIAVAPPDTMTGEPGLPGDVAVDEPPTAGDADTPTGSQAGPSA